MSSATAAATKKMKVVSNLAGNSADYSPFAREFMEKHPSAGLSAAVHAINCHTADMFLLFLSIISDKYGHSVDDLVATIKMDERWNEAQTHPLVKSLTYFEQADADAVESRLARKTPADVPTETLQEEVKAAKKAKAAPKAKAKTVSAVAEAAGVEESVVAAAAAEVPCMADACTTEVEVKPAKKAPAKKATAKVAAEEAPVAAAEEAVSEEKPKKKAPAKKTAEEAPAAATEEAVSEEKPKKKAPAKKTTTGDSAKPAVRGPTPAAVDELATSMASLTVEEAKPTATATPKKTIARKPTAAAKA